MKPNAAWKNHVGQLVTHPRNPTRRMEKALYVWQQARAEWHRTGSADSFYRLDRAAERLANQCTLSVLGVLPFE